ncbi:MAG: cold-shock protein [Pseudomonadales bacterium]
MPAIAAFFISIIIGAAGGFALQYFTDGISFFSAFVICSLCNLAAIGVFFQLNRSAAPQASSSTQAQNRNQGPKKTSNQKKPAKQKPAESKPVKQKAARPASDAPLEQGSVKWFNGNKGFGFITRDNGEEIFVHFRSIIDNDGGRRNLRDGQEVEFRVVDSDRGPQAEDVTVL